MRRDPSVVAVLKYPRGHWSKFNFNLDILAILRQSREGRPLGSARWLAKASRKHGRVAHEIGHGDSGRVDARVPHVITIRIMISPTLSC